MKNPKGTGDLRLKITTFADTKKDLEYIVVMKTGNVYRVIKRAAPNKWGDWLQIRSVLHDTGCALNDTDRCVLTDKITAIWEVITTPLTEIEKQSEFFFNKPVDEYKEAPKAEKVHKNLCPCGCELGENQIRCGDCEMKSVHKSRVNSIDKAIKEAFSFGVRKNEITDTVHEAMKKWTPRTK